MKNKLLVRSLLAIAMAFGSFVTHASSDDGPTFHQAGGLTYASGGVGEESRQLLSARANEFNLKLVFAITSGAFTSGVRVTIADAKGKTLLEAISDGPWFLAKLPVGKYRVVANYAGRAIEQSITVDTTVLRTVDFRWGDE